MSDVIFNQSITYTKIREPGLRIIKIDKNVVIVTHRLLDDGYTISSVKRNNKLYYYLYENKITGRKPILVFEVDIR